MKQINDHKRSRLSRDAVALAKEYKNNVIPISPKLAISFFAVSLIVLFGSVLLNVYIIPSEWTGAIGALISLSFFSFIFTCVGASEMVNSLRKKKHALSKDSIARLTHTVHTIKPQVEQFIDLINTHIHRTELGIYKEDNPDLLRLIPIAKKAAETLKQTTRLTNELVKMRSEQQAQDTAPIVQTDIDITDVLERFSEATRDALAYTHAQQEVRQLDTDCPLETIAHMKGVYAEIRGELPESKIPGAYQAATQRTPA